VSAVTSPGPGAGPGPSPVPAGLGQLDAARFDPRRTEGAGFADTVRSLRTALLLGWRIESNWTDPTLFIIYTVAKPVASLLLLVVMIQIIGGAASDATRTFVILGSALWATVIAGIQGPAWSILDDRERYRMLKYVAVSPSRLIVTLVGRGGARLAAGAMGTSVALVFSVIILGLRIDLGAVHWPYLALVLAIGIVPVGAVGVVLAAICLQTRQESWSYPEALAGAMFLVTGVVFPLAILPDPVEVLGLLNPITWWVEGVRRAIVPTGPTSIGGQGSLWTAVTGTSAPDGAQVLVALLLTGALVTLAATAIFRSSERRARDKGLLDRTTGS
jgi:ABC-2 type transport system permease protein